MPRIAGEGTDERIWRAWPGLRDCRVIRPRTLFARTRRLVIVAPHPDDEILGCGGLLGWALRWNCPVLILAATDGEASHPYSREWTPATLRARRRVERRVGLRRLGAGNAKVKAIAVPDGEIASHAQRLREALQACARADDLVVTTWSGDGHPDHDACGRVAQAVCASRGLASWQVPVWMWHWAAPGDPRVPWQRMRRLPLPVDIARRKAAALGAHRSQLEADPSTGRGPVVPASLQQGARRRYEMLIAP